MNKNSIFVSTFLLLLSVIEIVKCVSIKPAVEDVRDLDPNSPERLVNSVMYKVVNKYGCSTPDVNNTHLLVFGSKAWNFPPQDVNLTLSYPTDNTRMSSDHFDDYIITGFKVHLYIDGTNSYGFITDGGILEESISLSFVTIGGTTLWYQFWLYGVPKNIGIGKTLVSSQMLKIKC